MNRSFALAFGIVAAPVCALLAATVVIDFDTVTGPVKPVNGVGQPPMIGAPRKYPMMHYLKEAGIPYARLHDVGGPYGRNVFVDIPNLFRDFDADENDPKSYDFAFTDTLMKALVGNGVEPFFRLGVTIENHPGVARYRLDPPKDFAKWARVCEHVIRHYNEGWADGFRMNVTYWEIWNEPDNFENPEENCMWHAPFSEYVRLYGVAASYLKTKFPRLKIGGFASCGFYAAVKSEGVRAAHSSPRTEYFLTAANEFLKAVRDGGWPLDFFSFHSYSSPDEAMAQVRYADRLLNGYGFTADKTERIYNEWLPYVSHKNLGTALQAAGVASELVQLQNGPCDVACIYDARCGTGDYSPLFNPLTYEPHKAYYAFVAFSELRKRGQALKVSVSGPRGFHVAAAKGGSDVAIMFVNDSDEEVEVSCDLAGRSVAEVRYTDADQTNARKSSEDIPVPAVLPPHAFAVAIVR